MQYVSIDIETLGLDPLTCDTIEVGAVLDTITDPWNLPDIKELPRFQCYITKPNNIYQGEPYAMWMNAKILKRIADREEGFNYIPGDMLDEVFAEWLTDIWKHEHYPIIDPKPDRKVVMAGKNFASFDLPFLKRLGFGKSFKIHHRSLDPGSMYFDINKDEVPPDLTMCLHRAGIVKEVTHDAVEDALDVVRCVRHKLLQSADEPFRASSR